MRSFEAVGEQTLRVTEFLLFSKESLGQACISVKKPREIYKFWVVGVAMPAWLSVVLNEY